MTNKGRDVTASTGAGKYADRRLSLRRLPDTSGATAENVSDYSFRQIMLPKAVNGSHKFSHARFWHSCDDKHKFAYNRSKTFDFWHSSPQKLFHPRPNGSISD
ncbi:hypothetical protein [Vogesella indigofera]|uniref:hypothetical protein n=1 Tax=Vogesella indigofera TaxID=45465 RepID=UPI0011C40ABA|nr:hypothetical protein [Vogesella indigofera]